uniref:Uncharacterized protein n=1 Tax=Timema douglasi TaxID=61478 RepID=A0A7R8VB88_TIMDO|nr:unnamed protein product [Timema douglasi]
MVVEMRKAIKGKSTRICLEKEWKNHGDKTILNTFNRDLDQFDGERAATDCEGPVERYVNLIQPTGVNLGEVFGKDI